MSAGIQLVDPVILALRDRLEDGLPDEVGIQNSEVTDGHELDDPVLVLDYVPSLASLNQFPTVAIAMDPGHFEDDIGSSATGVYRLGVLVFIQDPDLEALNRKLRRYLRCIARVALAGRRLGTAQGEAWSIQPKAFAPGPVLSDRQNNGPLMSWAELTVEVKVDEE